MYYLDTSVLTGYYCAEERSDRVQQLLSSIREPVISSLVAVEFHCAVSRKMRAGAMDQTAALRVFSEFQRHVREPRYRVVPIREGDYALAQEWITQMISPLRVLDAIHLAAAFSNGLTLITADKVLAESAQSFKIRRKLVE